MKVEVADGNVGAALRELKRKLAFGQPPPHLARPPYYEKPSTRRRRKKKLGWLRALRRKNLAARDHVEDGWELRRAIECGERVRWLRATCQCESCRWLRGELDPP